MSAVQVALLLVAASAAAAPQTPRTPEAAAAAALDEFYAAGRRGDRAAFFAGFESPASQLWTGVDANGAPTTKWTAAHYQGQHAAPLLHVERVARTAEVQQSVSGAARSLAWIQDTLKAPGTDDAVHAAAVLLEAAPGQWRILHFNLSVPLAAAAVPARAPSGARPGRAQTASRLCSFNIRYGSANDGANSWPTRAEQVFDIVGRYHAVGLQEALKFQIDEILVALPGFAYAGVGRDDGEDGGEHSAIAFNTSALQLLEQDTFWFCNRPDQPGCVSYGNSIPRICTWARFADLTNGGAEFYLYNVHLDHQSANSREQSVRQLLATIAERTYPELPVVVTGDFNAGESSTPVVLMKQGGFVDTFRVLYPDATDVGTFNSWTGNKSGDKIDYVFAEPDAAVAAAAIVHDNIDGKYPSDHFPVDAELLF